MAELAPIRSGWNESLMILKGRLTDRAIERYRRLGWYSEEMRQARRDRQAKKQARALSRMKRDGQWLVRPNGERIYSPI